MDIEALRQIYFTAKTVTEIFPFDEKQPFLKW